MNEQFAEQMNEWMSSGQMDRNEFTKCVLT